LSFTNDGERQAAAITPGGGAQACRLPAAPRQALPWDVAVCAVQQRASSFPPSSSLVVQFCYRLTVSLCPGQLPVGPWVDSGPRPDTIFSFIHSFFFGESLSFIQFGVSHTLRHRRKVSWVLGCRLTGR